MPPSTALTRRLAAVWFADLVGYTRLSAENEPAALRLVSLLQEVARDEVERCQGRVVKFLGDGVLAEFGSTEAAVRCALALRGEFAARSTRVGLPSTLRIGAHVGDVTAAPDGDIYGDGVNIAARLQEQAEPGQVLVSEDVWHQLRARPEFALQALGERELKGIAASVAIFAVQVGEQPNEPAAPPSPGRTAGKGRGRRGPLRSAPRRQLALYGGGALLLVLLGLGLTVRSLGWQDVERVEASAAATPLLDRSVAVLPFANLSGDEQTTPFINGIHDDIITQLARIASLKVISRTSVQEYRNTTKNVRQISDELGVSVLLEGGVQRVGDRLRINVQLIDARTDVHLWAETFDRQFTLDNLFAIQSEIALQVASALRATLSPAERERLAARPTTSLTAYEFYVRAREQGGRSHEAADQQLALSLLEEAVRLDPHYAAAHANMGEIHTVFWWLHYDRTPEQLRLARAAIDRALELEPDLPEARLALGYYYYWGHLDYDRALTELERAAAALPSDARVALGIGAVHRRRGDLPQSALYLRRAAELDPRSGNIANNLAGTYSLMRAFDDALREVDRALALSPTTGSFHAVKSWILLRATGDPEQALAALEQTRRLGVADHPEIVRVGVIAELAAGRPSAARTWLDRLGERAVETQFFYIPAEQLHARIHEVEGDAAPARAAHEAARRRLERLVAERPDDPRFQAALGIALAGAGRFDEALRAGRRAVELMPVEREAVRGPYFLEDLAEIYARAGQAETAVEILERMLRSPQSLGDNVTEPLLRVDPRWAPLRTYPRFRQLLAGESGG